MDMEELGYFIFMEGQEEKAKQENGKREAYCLPFAYLLLWISVITYPLYNLRTLLERR